MRKQRTQRSAGQCMDCGTQLYVGGQWEPLIIQRTDSACQLIERTHEAMCFSCIADLEHIHEEESTPSTLAYSAAT